MVEIELNYKQNKIIIQAYIYNTLEIVINEFIIITKAIINNLYFEYNNKKLNKKLKIKDIIKESKNVNNCIRIFVYNKDDINKNIENNEITKYNSIFCPRCKESCKIEIKNYRIKLYGCRNGHVIENMKLNDYINLQNNDLSKIKCDKCKNNSNSLNDIFYICNKCKQILCCLCKSNHDKNHPMFYYNLNNSLCMKHNNIFIKYCEDCKLNLCSSCINDHINHGIISYKGKLLDTKNLRKTMDELRNIINKFKDNLENIIIKLKKIKENMDIYYIINNNILREYEVNKHIYYNLILNINYMNETIKNEILRIKYDYNYGNNLNEMIYLYNEMFEKNEEIEMKYIPKENNIEKIKIFGNLFIINNAYKCKILYKNNEYNLEEYFENIDNQYNHHDPIEFKLKGINNM